MTRVDGLTPRQWARVLRILRGPAGDALHAVRALAERRAPGALTTFLAASHAERSRR